MNIMYILPYWIKKYIWQLYLKYMLLSIYLMWQFPFQATRWRQSINLTGNFSTGTCGVFLSLIDISQRRFIFISNLFIESYPKVHQLGSEKTVCPFPSLSYFICFDFFLLNHNMIMLEFINVTSIFFIYFFQYFN